MAKLAASQPRSSKGASSQQPTVIGSRVYSVLEDEGICIFSFFKNISSPLQKFLLEFLSALKYKNRAYNTF